VDKCLTRFKKSTQPFIKNFNYALPSTFPSQTGAQIFRLDSPFLPAGEPTFLLLRKLPRKNSPDWSIPMKESGIHPPVCRLASP